MPKKEPDLDAVGPGSYETNQTTFLPAKNKISQLKSARLTNNVYKGNENEDDFDDGNDDSPGPGYYQSNDSCFNKKPLRYRNKSFGTKANRFIKHSNSVASSNLGPGFYDEMHSNERSFPHKLSAPFISEYKRFKQIDTKIPGPGTYIANITKSITNKQNTSKAFISCEKRFEDSLLYKDTPGPTDYHPLQCIKTLDKMKEEVSTNKHSSVFILPSTKSNKKISKQKVDQLPGDYSYNCNTIATQISTSVRRAQIKQILNKLRATKDTMYPKNKFIKEVDYRNAVGPGSYEIEREFDNEIDNGYSRYETLMRAERFAKIQEDSKPGPGAYSNEVDHWNKRSYNIMFT